ncbi:aminotransferase class V-fold PLP-dependent enzyme [Pyrococcus abyssi]|uniref:Aminotransferase, class-V n=1 Tax=Pyrococcus abyssi (strain GE5 / Orsay) TaxID=272844 RepID=Q9UYT2_PYRAB|nr:aminotransferase class V-fold PLP-dependent enzyme [Pyrococcus abyssi]CAB50330.1 Aminotransferase, class-V [Pyrococcus abyssi GE5]CCE70870.1 TPA: capreomycin acetyltransferase or nifs-like protein [Pyrococcus abyssi GE5]
MRELFPGLRRFRAYLNTAGLGLLPITVLKEVTEFLLDVIKYKEGINAVEILDPMYLEPVLSEAAKLMRTRSRNVGLSIQTTDGLKRALLALEPKKNMKIISFDLEFPTISAVVKSYAEKHNLKVEVIESKNGLYDISDVEKAIDDETFAVVFSDVQWITGQQMPTKEISEIAHEHGAWVIVDAVQSLGALQVYPEKLGVDVLVAGGEKWLLNPNMGSGIMYLSDRFLEEAKPIIGLLNTEPPVPWSDWWGDKDKDLWDILPVRGDARKLDPGTPAYLSAVALKPSLELINDVGIKKIEKEDLKLAEMVREWALEKGFNVLGDSQITLIVTGIEFEREKEIVRKLNEMGIIVSQRGAKGIHGIRVSPHLYNTKEDIEKFIEGIERFL